MKMSKLPILYLILHKSDPDYPGLPRFLLGGGGGEGEPLQLQVGGGGGGGGRGRKGEGAGINL